MGPKQKKAADSSHWLSPTATPGEDRESKETELAISPNPSPQRVLRPEGWALPGPLGRPADPDSPGRIANPSCNRSAAGMFPSACCAAPERFLPGAGRSEPNRVRSADRTHCRASPRTEPKPRGQVCGPNPIPGGKSANRTQAKAIPRTEPKPRGNPADRTQAPGAIPRTEPIVGQSCRPNPMSGSPADRTQSRGQSPQTEPNPRRSRGPNRLSVDPADRSQSQGQSCGPNPSNGVFRRTISALRPILFWPRETVGRAPVPTHRVAGGPPPDRDCGPAAEGS